MRTIALVSVCYVTVGCSLFEPVQQADGSFIRPIVAGLEDAGRSALENVDQAGGGPVGWITLAGSTLLAGIGSTVAALRGRRSQKNRAGFLGAATSVLSKTLERLKRDKSISKEKVGQAIEAEARLSKLLAPKSFRDLIEDEGVDVGRTTPEG